MLITVTEQSFGLGGVVFFRNLEYVQSNTWCSAYVR